MIKSAYAVIHFNCAEKGCRQNDTHLIGFRDETGKFNTELDIFSGLDPEIVVFSMRQDPTLSKWTIEDDGTAWCMMHPRKNV